VPLVRSTIGEDRPDDAAGAVGIRGASATGASCVRIFVDVIDPDVRMMRVMAELEQHLGCSPKKWRVVAEFKRMRAISNAEAEKTFRKLVLLEVVEHSRNGHCWLSEKGSQALVESQR